MEAFAIIMARVPFCAVTWRRKGSAFRPEHAVQPGVRSAGLRFFHAVFTAGPPRAPTNKNLLIDEKEQLL